MPRPENNRFVFEPPLFERFKPARIPMRSLEPVSLTLDEYEAIRLADFMGLKHEEASVEMGISRSTFTRLIEKARKKIADFIVNGKCLDIEGGNIHFKNNIIRCLACGYMFKIQIGDPYSECPECTSTDLLNLARGFGHGKCCCEEEALTEGNKKMINNS